MVNKKDLIVAVLITFCLTATLFIIMPTRSQIGGYDPWADIDDDGKINMYDIGYAARLFGTEGDPTKNVVVTNYNFINDTLFYMVAPSGTTSALVETAGFKEIVLGLEPAIACTVDINWLVGNSTAGKFYFEQTLTLSAGRNLEVLSVHGSRLWAVIHNPSPSSTMPIWFNYYMTA